MKLRIMTLTAIFAALCAVGGFIKIPSGVGSLALDTVPALLAASFLPPVFVGAASMIGHLASAMYAGFPLGPFHILIAIEMMIILYVFARLHKAERNVLKMGVLHRRERVACTIAILFPRVARVLCRGGAGDSVSDGH